MLPHEEEPVILVNDKGGRNPQKTTAVFDDVDPMSTVGVGGAFRVNGRYGHVSLGDMALRFDPNRSEINSGSASGVKPGNKSR